MLKKLFAFILCIGVAAGTLYCWIHNPFDRDSDFYDVIPKTEVNLPGQNTLLEFGDKIKDAADDVFAFDITTPEPVQSQNTEQYSESTQTTAPMQSTAPTEKNEDSGSSLWIRFIDVGQADAALVGVKDCADGCTGTCSEACEEYFMLIDGGNPDDTDIVRQAIIEAGVDELDILVATHLHSDHIGGLADVYSYTDVRLTLCPAAEYDSYYADEFLRCANANGGITVPKIGEIYYLGDAKVTILWVDGGPWEDINNSSIILKIEYGETSFLFTGDAEREAEQAVLDMGADISATVLKVGHHGSSSSTTYPFLREVMPEYGIISVGAGNSYGHPHDNVLSRLRDADVTVYRTDLCGDIYCYSDGETVTFRQ